MSFRQFFSELINLDQFTRTELLLGPEAMEKLKNSRIAVFGVGGVGSFALEALVRSGVGEVDIFDDDKVCLTNLNRQLFALRSTIGKYMVDVANVRLLDINPKLKINTRRMFYMPENADEVDLSVYSYIIDAIDTVTAKLELCERAYELGIPIISSMGAGNKLDPARFEVADIYETSVCPLARVMRRELKARGVKKLKVVCSKEQPLTPRDPFEACRKNCVCPPGTERKCTERRSIPGSTAFVPSVAGLIIAGEVIKDLTSDTKE